MKMHALIAAAALIVASASAPSAVLAQSVLVQPPGIKRTSRCGTISASPDGR